MQIHTDLTRIFCITDDIFQKLWQLWIRWIKESLCAATHYLEQGKNTINVSSITQWPVNIQSFIKCDIAQFSIYPD